MLIRETAMLKTELKKKLKVISLIGNFSPHIVELVLKKNDITNCLNDP